MKTYNWEGVNPDGYFLDKLEPIPSALPSFQKLFQVSATALSDRKSGSAGMPRPISYAVFCLKKKKTKVEEVNDRTTAVQLGTTLMRTGIIPFFLVIRFFFSSSSFLIFSFLLFFFFFFSMIPLPPTFTLFPYTTLFRSVSILTVIS